ncbi:DUF397 domain-containing protein [Streptomyces cucumeris]|uniref:DUF397 domain-containing protein n=1 Tax=Streptomyces cucumeris TaxID=2962890 RepID=UPI0020C8AAE0|nr:DUF397 domain-containing protein [Streptomyces sp. NEAU-Y11]MCP9206404.1 DUF397 domain-containing protein [Streptomyces sp. NEAU-Y11]
MKASGLERTSELVWIKSSYSSEEGGECVEVAAEWRKSSHSTGAGGECVEVASCLHAVHVRDSKDITRPGLTVGAVAWTAFINFAAR